MAYALTVDLKHIPIAVIDYDQSQTSRAFIHQITAGQDLDLFAHVSSMDEIERMLMLGQIKAPISVKIF
jgi:ABC-2 type transport system permease protein